MALQAPAVRLAQWLSRRVTTPRCTGAQATLRLRCAAAHTRRSVQLHTGRLLAAGGQGDGDDADAKKQQQQARLAALTNHFASQSSGTERSTGQGSDGSWRQQQGQQSSSHGVGAGWRRTNGNGSKKSMPQSRYDQAVSGSGGDDDGGQGTRSFSQRFAKVGKKDRWSKAAASGSRSGNGSITQESTLAGKKKQGSWVKSKRDGDSFEGDGRKKGSSKYNTPGRDSGDGAKGGDKRQQSKPGKQTNSQQKQKQQPKQKQAVQQNASDRDLRTARIKELTAMLEASRSLNVKTGAIRAPVVTIMGHVDHGKTTLLDALRQSSVAAGEAGGITQHIGAFTVKLSTEEFITFLDTPGHEAFSGMRERGAFATDVVILVVAADDGVMPQTRESIQLARSAGVPIVVAINKCDKQNADPGTVKQMLQQEGLELEDFGGDIQCIEISALHKKNIDTLEEALILQAELSELRGDPKSAAKGIVIETQTDKSKGLLASVVVRDGTLRVGDFITAGTAIGKVRSLMSNGKATKSVPLSTAAEVGGWRTLPEVGATFSVFKKEADAKKMANDEAELARLIDEEKLEEFTELRQQQMKDIDAQQQKGTKHERRSKSESRHERVAKETELMDESSGFPTYHLLVKADCQGTCDALETLIGDLPQQKVVCKIVRSSLGAVTPQDIELAEATNADIISFNVNTPKAMVRKVQSAGVGYLSHSVVYNLLDNIRERMAEQLPPDVEDRVIGSGTVLEIFELRGKAKGTVAGFECTTGEIVRKQFFRVLRKKEIVFDGAATKLKHFKQEVSTLPKGQQGGLMFEDWQGARPGDIIECYEKVEVHPKIE
eukprot:m.20048 g.20048  ORF g.20048 m.20048 type:complete len:831 (-) comp8108_c0_seq3:3860-6352(-)